MGDTAILSGPDHPAPTDQRTCPSSELSAARIDHVALVVLRAVGSLTAVGLSEQAQAELAQAELDALLVKPEETGPANQ